jgi:hypothetical protein
LNDVATSPRRGARTPNLLFVREALSAIELPAVADAVLTVFQRKGSRRNHGFPRVKNAPARFERAHGGFEAHCSESTELRGGSGSSRARTCERSPVHASATRCLADSAMPPGEEGARPGVVPAGTRGAPWEERRARRKERESNPQGRAPHPFSRRDTAPMAVLPRRACETSVEIGARGRESGRLQGCSARRGSAVERIRDLRRKQWLQQGSNLHVPG